MRTSRLWWVRLKDQRILEAIGGVGGPSSLEGLLLKIIFTMKKNLTDLNLSLDTSFAEFKELLLAQDEGITVTYWSSQMRYKLEEYLSSWEDAQDAIMESLPLSAGTRTMSTSSTTVFTPTPAAGAHGSSSQGTKRTFAGILLGGVSVPVLRGGAGMMSSSISVREGDTLYTSKWDTAPSQYLMKLECWNMADLRGVPTSDKWSCF
jgi:hypothetical protein